jgi:type II secretory pathway component GspD/PulD (secretin)
MILMRGILTHGSRSHTTNRAFRAWPWLVLAIVAISIGGCAASSGHKDAGGDSRGDMAVNLDAVTAPAVSQASPNPGGEEDRNTPKAQRMPLDVPGQKGVTCEVYPLQIQSPSNLAGVLNELLAPADDDEEGNDEQTSAPDDMTITVIPDETTRSLIVCAGRANQEQIAQLIRRLDTQLQIRIDCTIVEVAKSDEFALAIGTQTGFLDGAHPGFFSDKQVNALLTDMCLKGYGRVVNKPRLITSNHLAATAETKETVYAKGSSQYYNPYETGLTLTVTPHVGQADTIQLDVVIASSAFVKAASPAPPGIVSDKTEISVTLPAGVTTIFGGFRRPADNRNAETHLYLFLRGETLRP